MPVFRSTKDIFKTPWEDEVFNPNWMDSDKLITPPTKDWSYDRELTVQDVDIWEELAARGGGLGIYAAWCPYAEFYMITLHGFRSMPNRVETYYGKGADKIVYNRAKELGINLQVFTNWVEDEQVKLINKPLESKSIILLP